MKAPVTDWLAVIEAKRNEASGGPFAGEWGGYWQLDLLEPGEAPGPAVGIWSTTYCQERVTPEMAEQGIDPAESVTGELVALLAWHEDGEELPRFEENIDYICELHNRFPIIASELRSSRNLLAKLDRLFAAQWISVQELLPKHGEQVVAYYNERGKKPYQSIVTVTSAFPYAGITHWQPLQPAPNQGKEPQS